MKIFQMSFSLHSENKCMVEMALFNAQRVIHVTQKVGIPELRFIYSECRLIKP